MRANKAGSLVLCVLVASLLACADSKQATVSAPTVPQWKLADSARLTIGGKGDSAIVQHPIAAHLYSEVHELLVVDDGASPSNRFSNSGQQILFFDSRTGKVLRKLGRKGSGPREFQQMHAVSIFGDTLRVLDGATMRLTSWVRGEEDPTIRKFDAVKLDSGAASYQLALAGGSVLFRVEFHSPAIEGRGIDSIDLLVVDATGGIIHHTGRFELWEWVQYKNAEGQGFSSGAPYRASTMFKSAADGGFWVGEMNAGKLHRISADGTKRVLVDLPVVRQQATDVDKKAYADWILDIWQKLMGDRGRAAAKEMLKQVTFPPLLPAFSVGGIASSSDGGVWVAEYARADAPSRKWYVVSPVGSLRASIDLPRDLEVIDAGDDYLVGQRTDPNGGVTVVVHDITH